MTIEQSSLYAMTQGKHCFRVSADEVRLFLAILFNSGYAPLPPRRLYWEPSHDIQNIAISKAMTRNRFDEIIAYLHLADNEQLSSTDKVAKVRPLLSMINERFLTYFPKQALLSIDESMLPYYGRHGMKQFIRSKPIRFEYKIWCFNTPQSYCVQFEPYQGASNTKIPDVGLGGSVILDLVSELPPAKYQLYFDNFFISPKILDRLREKGFRATGTIRKNRLEKCPLSTPEEMKRQSRGMYDFRHDKNSGILVVRWHDNSIVTIATNCHGIEPVRQALRWSYGDCKKIAINQPQVIASTISIWEVLIEWIRTFLSIEYPSGRRNGAGLSSRTVLMLQCRTPGLFTDNLLRTPGCHLINWSFVEQFARPTSQGIQ